MQEFFNFLLTEYISPNLSSILQVASLGVILLLALYGIINTHLEIKKDAKDMAKKKT